MKKQKAMKWVEALRSGEYKQGRGTLKRENNKGEIKHCCLGVLAEISRCKQTDIWELGSLDFEDMQAKCGLRSNDGQAFDDKIQDNVKIKIRVAGSVHKLDSLAQANDRDISFKAISKWIEKNYKLL